MKEWFKKHRPKKLSQIVGNVATVSALQRFLDDDELPHTLMFTGQSGCGKTTTARCLARTLGCGEFDYEEINCANLRGIDDIRKIADRMSLAPVGGKARMFVFDEVHQLTSAGQSMALKPLEDTPAHVYFVLCTNLPEKLLPTIRNRCTTFKMESLDRTNMRKWLDYLCEQEKQSKASDPVLTAIMDASEGSPRLAATLLQKACLHKTDEERLASIHKDDIKKAAIDLARAIHEKGADWKKVAALIKACDEDPETVRRCVLGYANSVMLGGGPLAPRAYFVMEAFERNWFDTGKVGLTKACWEVIKQ